MIFITDEFLRTRNSFCSCETECYAKLNREKEQIFLHDPGKFILEKKFARFSKDDFDSSIYINLSLKGIISSVDISGNVVWVL